MLRRHISREILFLAQCYDVAAPKHPPHMSHQRKKSPPTSPAYHRRMHRQQTRTSTFTHSPSLPPSQEYLRGGSLSEYLATRERVDEYHAAVIMSNVFHGIHACRARGLAHCDVKPENFMFTYDPDKTTDMQLAGLKLVDFGCCVNCMEPVRLKAIEGTARYLAPEVCQFWLTPNSDMWSAGMVVGAGWWVVRRVANEQLS